MADDEDLIETRRRFLAGLRVAVVVIAFAVLATASLFRNLDAHQALWVQLLSFGALLSVVATELVLIIGKQVWGKWRWPALVVAAAASASAAVALPMGAWTTALDWCYGSMGWIGVILFLDRPARYLLIFLAAHEIFTISVIVLSGGDSAALLNAATATIGAIGFPLAAGTAATALRDIAAGAHRAATESEHLQTAEAVGNARHERRREQFTNLDRTSVPLLRGIADGVLDPKDPDVARTCAIEAARMRRLFAEADDVSDPLHHELLHCADIADRRNVVVEFESHGMVPELSTSVRRALTEAPLNALATAQRWARITVTGNTDLVSVDVVADCGEIRIPVADERLNVAVESITEGEVLWVRSRWQQNQ